MTILLSLLKYLSEDFRDLFASSRLQYNDQFSFSFSIMKHLHINAKTNYNNHQVYNKLLYLRKLKY